MLIYGDYYTAAGQSVKMEQGIKKALPSSVLNGNEIVGIQVLSKVSQRKLVKPLAENY